MHLDVLDYHTKTMYKKQYLKFMHYSFKLQIQLNNTKNYFYKQQNLLMAVKKDTNLQIHISWHNFRPIHQSILEMAKLPIFAPN